MSIQGISLNREPLNRDPTVYSYTAVRGEGRCPKITVATGREAREPKTYILLVRRAKPLDY